MLEPRSVLRIRFRVPAGQPPVEGAVALDRGGGWIPFAASEALLTGLPEGKAGIKYHSEAYGGGVIFVDLGPDRRLDTAVDLARPDWVEGRLLDERGSPLAGALYRPENAFRGMASRTGEDGVFRVRRPRAGVRHVQFRDPRFRDTTLELGREAGRVPPGGAPRSGRIPDCRPGGPPRRTARRLPGRSRARPNPARPPPRAPAGPGPRPAARSPGPTAASSSTAWRRKPTGYGWNAPARTWPRPWRIPARAFRPWRRARPAPWKAAWRSAAAANPSPSRPSRPSARRRKARKPPSWTRPDSGDSLGRFTLSPRFEGDNHLCASAPGFAPACRLLASGDTLPARVELEPAHALTVRVRAADSGRPLPGARVRVRRAGSRDFAWAGETDERGRLHGRGPGPGRIPGGRARRRTDALP